LAIYEVWQVNSELTLTGIVIGQDLVVYEWQTKGVWDDDDDAFGSSPIWWFGDAGRETVHRGLLACWLLIMMDSSGEAGWTRHCG
jgi:hypothetical protein